MPFSTAQTRFAKRLLALVVVAYAPFLAYKSAHILTCDSIYPATTSRHDHLAIGSSKMQSALSPADFMSASSLTGDFQNIAITGGVTPYGPLLLRLARNKVRGNSTHCPRVFILEYSSGLLCSRNRLAKREEDQSIHELWFQSMNPNLEYLLRPRKGEPAMAFSQWGSLENSGYERNGWFNRTRKKPLKSNLVQWHEERMTKTYDPERGEAFLTLVDELTALGDVFLVRLPTRKEVRDLGSLKNTPADSVFQLALLHPKVQFLDCHIWGDSSDFADTNHLLGKSGRRLSGEIGREVMRILQEHERATPQH